MIIFELLEEKDQIQNRLSNECTSVHEYLINAQLAAKELATTYGFDLQYVKVPTESINLTAASDCNKL